MTPRDEARKFLRIAAQDEVLLDKLLTDHEVTDSVWAFHAQQAAEKLLKAVLMDRRVVFPKTHDLATLHQLATRSAITPPVSLDEIDELTPFAVEYRYTEMLGATIDRAALRDIVRRIREWADSLVEDSSQSKK